MKKEWEIGQEAVELDNKSIAERMRVERKTIKKWMSSIGIYFAIMIILSLML